MNRDSAIWPKRPTKESRDKENQVHNQLHFSAHNSVNTGPIPSIQSPVAINELSAYQIDRDTLDRRTILRDCVEYLFESSVHSFNCANASANAPDA